MIATPFVSVRLGVTYGLGPVMKTVPSFMTVPNLLCQRAAIGEVLRVQEDRPLAFIHVADAAEALLLAAERRVMWEVVNAAPEVASIGHVARLVQRIAHQRHRSVRVQGAASLDPPMFTVRSRLPLEPRHTLQGSLGEVFDYFAVG
jgi:nucleoside-diphosphate-sugar epimerase